METYVYIIFSNNQKIDKGEYSIGNYPSIKYISLSKNEAYDWFDSKRYECFNMPENEIDEDSPNEFGVQVGKWWYHYWIEKYPLNTQI